MIPSPEWQAAQKFELNWWSNARDRWPIEIANGTIIASLMGIPWDFDLGYVSILDIGSGPFSLLLRVKGAARRVALDPLKFLPEHEEAYRVAGVERWIMPGENLIGYNGEGKFDEIWIYNCLQHTQEPGRVLENAARIGKRIRVFEWVYMPPYTGHLHTITPGMIASYFVDRKRTLWNEGRFENVGGLNGHFFAVVSE